MRIGKFILAILGSKDELKSIKSTGYKLVEGENIFSLYTCKISKKSTFASKILDQHKNAILIYSYQDFLDTLQLKCDQLGCQLDYGFVDYEESIFAKFSDKPENSYRNEFKIIISSPKEVILSGLGELCSDAITTKDLAKIKLSHL